MKPEYKYVNPSTGMLNLVCIDCGGKCSMGCTRCRKCAGKRQSITRSGKDNPFFKHGRTNHNKCACGNHIGQHSTICRPCYAIKRKTMVLGDNNPKWRGGAALLTYPRGWTETLKDAIRKRDGYKCRECGCPQTECLKKLHVHHIDYDKKNLDINNLITLCASCHMKTTSFSQKWIDRYKEAVCNSGI